MTQCCVENDKTRGPIAGGLLAEWSLLRLQFSIRINHPPVQHIDTHKSSGILSDT